VKFHLWFVLFLLLGFVVGFCVYTKVCHSRLPAVANDPSEAETGPLLDQGGPATEDAMPVVQADEQIADKPAKQPGEKPAAESSGKSGGLPPLVVDRDQPLLLDDGPEKVEDPADKGPMADNLACHCCHTNYKEEPLAVIHAKAEVGCVDCHGDSFAHRDDEDNVTPPDVMYPPEKIDAACQECHEKHDAPARKVLARWQERCPAKEDFNQIVCTDCHGRHRLPVRTVWWNKKTRKLIIRKEGTVKRAVDYTKKPVKEDKRKRKSHEGNAPEDEMH